MSTDTKTHKIELSRLSIVYLRAALNNPGWTNGLDDYVKGCDTLRALPKLYVPKTITNDEDVLRWGDEPGTNVIVDLSDESRDTCRQALKKFFEIKAVSMNEHSVDLIKKFSLKS